MMLFGRQSCRRCGCKRTDLYCSKCGARHPRERMGPKLTQEFNQGNAAVYTATGFYDTRSAADIPGIPKVGSPHPIDGFRRVEEWRVYELGPGMFRVFVS